MKGEIKLIIQIPCFNEADTLKVTLDALPRKISGVDKIEYLVINDGSSDGTVQVAKDWGVNYIVSFKQNKGLARGFMAGLDAALRNGADIIVNTDADNQYCADDIERLIQPILDEKFDIVIGERPIDDTKHFSPLKKKLQHLGSWVVRKASASSIPDAPSGFRAYSRQAAMQINVINEYTYTLETIIQAGRDKMAMTSVPVHTNEELRKSRLFKNTMGYVKKSGGGNYTFLCYVQPIKILFDYRRDSFFHGGTNWDTFSWILLFWIRRRTCSVFDFGSGIVDDWMANHYDWNSGRYSSCKS